MSGGICGKPISEPDGKCGAAHRPDCSPDLAVLTEALAAAVPDDTPPPVMERVAASHRQIVADVREQAAQQDHFFQLATRHAMAGYHPDRSAGIAQRIEQSLKETVRQHHAHVDSIVDNIDEVVDETGSDGGLRVNTARWARQHQRDIDNWAADTTNRVRRWRATNPDDPIELTRVLAEAQRWRMDLDRHLIQGADGTIESAHGVQRAA